MQGSALHPLRNFLKKVSENFKNFQKTTGGIFSSSIVFAEITVLYDFLGKAILPKCRHVNRLKIEDFQRHSTLVRTPR